MKEQLPSVQIIIIIIVIIIIIWYPPSVHPNRQKHKWTTSQPSHPPITWSNNKVTIIFLKQMGQCNGCRSVRNDIIFNSHLGYGAGRWVSILRFLQQISHIHWLHLPKHSSKKEQKILKKDQTPNKLHFIALALCTQSPGLRQVDLEPSPKRGTDKTNRLRPRRKNTTENKLYHRALTHKWETSS